MSFNFISSYPFSPFQGNTYNSYNLINPSQNAEQNSNYKLLFWNLLCDEYSYDWKTSPKLELKYKIWEYRSKLFEKILSEKKNICDLYCFVEVDKQDDFYLMLNNIAKQKLYESIYFPRKNTPLGIMLIYNRYKFKVINTYKYLLANSESKSFALCAILQENAQPYNIFCVIITHLIAWDKNEHIRVKQVYNLFNNIKNDKNLYNLKVNKYILCGDFNANPENECVNIIMNNCFKSVFDYDKNDQNYTIVIDTLDEGLKKLKYDYIFTTDNIKVCDKYLPVQYLDFENGMPNQNFPSDHLFLKFDFKFCHKNQEKPVNFK